jgi:hypothetical protein
MGGQPVGHLAGLEPVHVEGEAGLVDLLLRLERLEEPVAEHPELQAVEEGVHLLAVPGTHRQVRRGERKLEVADQGVELPVADHVVEVLAQALARLALDLLGAVDHVVEAVVGRQPLGGRLGTDPRDPREVVGGLTDQCGHLRVATRLHAVLLLDRGRGHPLHLRHTAHRVDHRGALVDQLEGVPVAGADQHLEVVGQSLRGQGADDVVGLEAHLLQEGDPQRVEHLLDQRDLALELVW